MSFLFILSLPFFLSNNKQQTETVLNLFEHNISLSSTRKLEKCLRFNNIKLQKTFFIIIMSSSLPNSLGILLWGMTSRFLLSCIGWTAMRISRSAISSKPDVAVKKAIIKNTNYLKIWLGSYCLETGVSLLIAPGPYMVGKAVCRVMLDSFAPSLSDVLFKLDNFSHAGFLSFASTRLIRESPSASAVAASNNHPHHHHHQNNTSPPK